MDIDGSSITNIQQPHNLIVSNHEYDIRKNANKVLGDGRTPKGATHLSPDEIQAETIFTSSIKRLVSGRFSVDLLFRHPFPILANSKDGALRRFQTLERRLAQDPNLGKKYSDFMQDYLEVVPESNTITPYCYYIPHHYILRPESQTTKLRVVFDASS